VLFMNRVPRSRFRRWRTIALAALAAGGCRSSGSRVAAPSPTLSDTTAELCAGVPQAERERPYFLQQSGIEAIREFTGGQHFVKFAKSELRGAEIAVRAQPGGTKEHVGRLLRCHLAWRDAAGFAVQNFDDPLAAGRPEVSFDQSGTGIVIRIVGRDGAQGEEILRRAEALLE
jgi:hypothetical protein